MARLARFSASAMSLSWVLAPILRRFGFLRVGDGERDAAGEVKVHGVDALDRSLSRLAGASQTSGGNSLELPEKGVLVAVGKSSGASASSA